MSGLHEHKMHKYPRTPHIAGSRLQRGDEDLAVVTLKHFAGRHIVIEEKIDGANAGLRFDANGQPILQSRGHVLHGGPREQQFDLLKAWAIHHREQLFATLGERYLMFGEWVYAHHTVYYDQLPHYFIEFDLFDTTGQVFLDTARRRQLLDGLPVVSAPVLHEGDVDVLKRPTDLVTKSCYKSENWRDALIASAGEAGVDSDYLLSQSDRTNYAEGLYIKWERDGEVAGRYKFVRDSFRAVVDASDNHWAKRPMVINVLQPGIDLFETASP